MLRDDIEVAERYSPRQSVSLPSLSLLGPGAEVIIADGEVDEQAIIDALKTLP